jgi:hypothetical protein
MDFERVTGAHAAGVMSRVLAHESTKRKHVVVALSGAHAYGFPSPDSDLDLKGIHAAPTREHLGLGLPPGAASRLEVIDGVEIDYTSNELKDALLGILHGNGNYIERVLGKLVPVDSPRREELASLTRASLSRRIHRHYRGFATSQLRAAEEGPCTAKKLLYVIRTALTGAHALRSGEVVNDVNELLGEYGFEEAEELLAIKRRAEREALPAEARDRWMTKIHRAFDVLDAAESASPLPIEPPNRDAMEAFLLDVRREDA